MITMKKLFFRRLYEHFENIIFCPLNARLMSIFQRDGRYFEVTLKKSFLAKKGRDFEITLKITTSNISNKRTLLIKMISQNRCKSFVGYISVNISISRKVYFGSLRKNLCFANITENINIRGKAFVLSFILHICPTSTF